MSAFYADYIKNEDKQFIKDCLNEIRSPVEVAVYGSKNYFNLGSIIRTGHSFLVNKYWAIDCPAFYEKAAMTARPYEKDRIDYSETVSDWLSKVEGRNIVCIEKDDDLKSEDMRTFHYPENPILVFGLENEGVPKEILHRPNTKIVAIPMLGLVHSFNVACAAAIALYDWHNKHTTRSV